MLENNDNLYKDALGNAHNISQSVSSSDLTKGNCTQNMANSELFQHNLSIEHHVSKTTEWLNIF